jgi:glycosyltransferase involved in cell wall biosynthesis
MSDALGDGQGRIVPTVGRASLYASFDVFPSSKGAATHIRHMVEVLFERAGGGTLLCLGDDELPAHQVEGDCEIVRFNAPIDNVLERAMAFGDRAAALARDLGDDVKIMHFRDPFAGLPLLDEGSQRAWRVYEINGLPSIEMPARYPRLTRPTIEMLRRLEDRCCAEADVIIVPAAVIGGALEARGVDAAKIKVIRNGAEAPAQAPRPSAAPKKYFFYFGAVQPWQGVDVALRAFARIAAGNSDDDDVGLVIAASTRPRSTKALMRLAEKLGVAERVTFLHRLDKIELAGWLRHATATLAPLTACARNIDQGCCPLKILESMAAGVPVLSSDLPAVRELVGDDEAILLPPDRPEAWARAMLLVLEDDAEAKAMAARALLKVQGTLSWQRARNELAAIYDALLASDRQAAPQRGPAL